MDKELKIKIRYQMVSDIDDWIESDNQYIQTYCGDILGQYEGEFDIFLIGQQTFKILLLEQYCEQGFSDIEDVFENDDYAYTIKGLWDFVNKDFNPELRRKLKIKKQHNRNICLLEKLEILPPFRGLEIAQSVIRDVFFQFQKTCGLFVLEPVPLQLVNKKSIPYLDETWYELMQYNKLDANADVSKKNLVKYYRMLPFKIIRDCKWLFLVSGQEDMVRKTMVGRSLFSVDEIRYKKQHSFVRKNKLIAKQMTEYLLLDKSFVTCTNLPKAPYTHSINK
ncbi:MAG: hypothetical protein MJZ75_05700 [Paludibacteraceae bacterium]|nr:hypothetical protein [Paludibacteraceae bacterium]